MARNFEWNGDSHLRVIAVKSRHGVMTKGLGLYRDQIAIPKKLL